jgi:hypothetical protein
MNIFQQTSCWWVKYGKYEYKEDNNGVLYIIPAKRAKPKLYDPLKNPETMILSALNVGMLAMKRVEETELQQAVLDFVSEYGLLGFMTALPATPHFLDYKEVFLPKNHHIKVETMSTQDYIDIFFPFNKPDFQKDERTTQWNIANDRDMIALAMTMAGEPMALNMCLGRDYAERYDWIVRQFKDWAFTFSGAFLYYNDYDSLDETSLDLYRQGVAAFGGIAPTYHIKLADKKPSVVWDFHSLLLAIQTMFGFMLTDEKKPLRLCKHCAKVFTAGHPNAAFCSPACKNKYNVYRSRGKK